MRDRVEIARDPQGLASRSRKSAFGLAKLTTVNLFNGTSLVDTFKLNGNYGLSNFTFHGDGHGGALMSYVPPATHTVAPLLHA